MEQHSHTVEYCSPHHPKASPPDQPAERPKKGAVEDNLSWFHHDIYTTPEEKEIEEKFFIYRISLRSFEFPAVSIFSSSGLELQLGHPIASDLQQDVGISPTNNSQALIYYRFLTVFLTIASQQFGRARRTFSLFAENSEKADKRNRPVSNDHHDQLHM